MTEPNYGEIRKMLSQYNQEHLIKFLDQLNKDQQKELLTQIQKLDFEQIDKWIADIILTTDTSAPVSDCESSPFYEVPPAGDEHRKLYAEAVALGRENISQGRIAAFVVAGGQGTRLGFDGPKGDFPLSPIKNKTLFRLFAEQIASVSQKYSVSLPWYVMTSPLNYQRTCEIFESNDYYGLDPKDVCIFQQGTLPNFGFDGKILLADKGTIACSPDGHGGSLKALHDSGAIEDMKKRGVKYISYWQVDNPMINIFDPLFVGLHILDKSEMSSKALIKTGPMEKVGNFCLVNDRVTVIEYSDLPDELAESKNPDGSYVFELGSIAIHMISTDFVERLNSKGFALPLHRAVKKIPCIDDNGNQIRPDKPNGIKLETFVFDALPLAKNSMILQTIREQEFAPVKNATGVDSAESSRAMLIERCAGWLEEAGVKVPRKADGSVDAIIEIAASFAASPEELKDKLDKIPPIKPNESVYLQ
jgi:UDP-N-acetylglucosamine/UDP-N-acetylgalactosamine diphosphorylase